MPKDFITIGTDMIIPEGFRKVSRPEDADAFKPVGGIWATEYQKDSPLICPWISYILEHKELMRFKNCDSGCIFSLDPISNVVTIDSLDVIETLADKYPSVHHRLLFVDEKYALDYEKMSLDYDAAYIDLDGIPKSLQQKSNTNPRPFSAFDVSSLLVFNVNAIKEYRSVKFYAKKGFKIKHINKSVYQESTKLEFYALYDYIEEIFNASIKMLEVPNVIMNYPGYLKKLSRTKTLLLEQIKFEKSKAYKSALKVYGSERINQIINAIIDNLITDKMMVDEEPLTKLTFGL